MPCPAPSPLFFKAHCLDAALVDISALLGVATATAVHMSKSTKKPEVIWPLLGPYLGWLAFATALNAEVLRQNSTETWLDWKKVGEDVDKKTEKARNAAKDAATKAAAATQAAAAKASEATRDAASKAAAAAQGAASKVGAAAVDTAGRAAEAAGYISEEVKAKAAHDMAELKSALE
ncbi:hypothetical protein MNEG_11649 [Monoraphidium neglectum]|uniref:Uncharacterized protein n=1 Tax=Monoraphidium neglectum TaxID=145388 RepID=A0A0D2MNN8_9CHLO|nr:hypothetical protein MNEG_11649 [Monoraphidium neglectum]KIY96315.1 hypothetical protein MNEG_11649 [Monoraphidium neglectum]|eukprot:XP_013895335.1 hypothetical protein MNEG_11649 [Monoraphidium neglectum]